MVLLLTKLPEFKVHWNKYYDKEIEFEEEFDPSLYDVAWEFSSCVIEQFKYGNDEFLKDAFKLVEEMSEHPDSGVANCAMVGFVEGVLMLRSHERIELSAFDSYLGNNSKKFWYDMHNFFYGQSVTTAAWQYYISVKQK